MAFAVTELSGYDAFCLYHSLKLHFTSEPYSYIKYNGKTNLSKSSFEVRKDKYSFCRISRKYSSDKLKDFYIANFVDRNVQWIGDCLSDEADSCYKDWMKRTESLTYRLTEDIDHLMDLVESPGQLFAVESGSYPLLLQQVNRKEVMIETLIILNAFVKFLDIWNGKITDTVIWPNTYLKLKKYAELLHFDYGKCKNILKNKLK